MLYPQHDIKHKDFVFEVLFTAADVKSAPLLPKLRGHFAEFLNESSLAHLRLLASTTCVGLRYG